MSFFPLFAQHESARGVLPRGQAIFELQYLNYLLRVLEIVLIQLVLIRILHDKIFLLSGVGEETE